MISIRLDPADLLGELSDISKRQLPYATALALNAVAFDFQKEQQDALPQRFNLRQSVFIKRGIYFPREQRADYRAGRMSATVSIEPQRGILNKFEAGGWKQPKSGSRVAVPILARRGKKGNIAEKNTIKALQLRVHGRGATATVGRGLDRTWSVRYPDGRGYIFRRVGKGKRSGLRILYVFRPRVPIPPALQFHETAMRTARERFAPRFAEAFAKALSTAR